MLDLTRQKYMRNIKSLFSAALLSCSMLFTASSNAALITETIYAGGIEIATIEMQLDDSLINSGLGVVSTVDMIGFDLIDVVVPLALGFNPVLNDFEAIIDVDNLFAGSEYISLDVEDDAGWFYYVYFDAFSTIDNYASVFEYGTGFLLEAFEDDVQVVSTVAVSVSEPSLFVIFALAMGGLVMRRRA